MNRAWWLLAVVCVLLWPVLPAQAQTPADRVLRIEPVVHDGRLHIQADIQLTIPDELRHVAHKGVPLYFTADLQLMQQRWWWFDRTVIDTRQTWKVTYNALTRQWRVGAGELSLPADSLEDALLPVREIRHWSVAPLSALEHDTTYHGRMRLRLDTSLLARPFQVDALNSSAWSLATPWKTFDFSISAGEPRP